MPDTPEKSIENVAPGQLGEYPDVYDYNHVLAPEHIKRGYSLETKISPGTQTTLYSKLLHHGSPVGYLEASVHPDNSLRVFESLIQPEHRGSGLGQALYEATLAHAKHGLGATHIVGGTHSTAAARVHEKLATKHGLGYVANPNYGHTSTAHWETKPEWDKAHVGDRDERFAPYSYALKSELGKKALDPNLGVAFTHQHHDLGGVGDLTHVKAHLPNGQLVGEAVFEHQANGALKPSDVQVHSDHRRKGIASAIYQHAQKLTGKAVQPSTAQTPMGAALWAGNKLHPQFGKSERLLRAIRMNREQLRKNHLYVVPVGVDKDRNIKDSAAHNLLGSKYKIHPAFEAARFLANTPEATQEDTRKALHKFDGDYIAAALYLYGIPDTKENRKAIAAHQEMNKSEKELHPMEAKPIVPESKDVAEALTRAFNSSHIESVKLGGKHTKGAFLANDDQTHLTWLLKPNAGGTSKAAGVSEEPANQARREGAFWWTSRLFGLENYFPKADAVRITMADGSVDEWAAIVMLPHEWRPVADIKEDDNNYVMRVLEKYRKSGVLHQWAVIDYVLGNPDRHTNNALMKETNILLIDQGSAFAGKDFAPGTDKNSFVPFYLRYLLVGKNFHALSSEDKLKWMPLVDGEIDDMLEFWVKSLDVNVMASIVREYGIDPESSIERLLKLQHTDGSMVEAINRVWAFS